MKLLEKLYPSWLSNKNVEQEYKFVIEYGDLEVGTLSTNNKNNERIYIFKYSEKFKEQYQDKNKKEIIKKLAGFKEFKEYESQDLYPFFLSRMPDPNRPIIKEIVEKEEINADDPLAILDRFGKRTLDNPFIVRRIKQ